MMPYTYDYPRPAVTVDAVVFNRRHELLLIRRKKEPFLGCWALPGGFMEIDETLDMAVYRELKEETGLSDVRLERFGVYDAVDRDPRGRTLSVVYHGCIDSIKQPGVAADDAAALNWFPVHHLPVMAFDHDRIIADVLETW